MIFEQFYLESLGHASYLVGDERTGRALVLDPRRDVEVYLESVRMHGLRIAYAIDTHGHNDHLSGLSELRLRQDIEVLGFAGADLGYDHRSVTDGEIIEMGDIAFEGQPYTQRVRVEAPYIDMAFASYRVEEVRAPVTELVSNGDGTVSFPHPLGRGAEYTVVSVRPTVTADLLPTAVRHWVRSSATVTW